MNGTITAALPTATVAKPCIPITDDLQPVVVYSIVHTATITFSGNASHHAPTYPVIETPHYCSPSLAHSYPPYKKKTKSMGSKGTDHPPDATDGKLKMPPPSFRFTYASPRPRPTITFITTDKNPMVVSPTDRPPDSSHGDGSGDPYPDPVIHKSAKPLGTGPCPTPDVELKPRPRPTFHITANGNQVVIDAQTFSAGPGATAVVQVDGGLFTILPDAVVGEGGMVTKPPPVPTQLSAPSPESGMVGGLDVFVSGPDLVVGGVAMKIPAYTTTTMIDGRDVNISPGIIAVNGSIFVFNLTQPPPDPQVIVEGGQVVTAIGKNVVVLHETTITYGPDIPPLTEFVGDEALTIGPAGVVFNGMTMGGPMAGVNDTHLEIVGGATISRIAPYILVINNRVFTLSPEMARTTTDIGGQLLTIGPFGVAGSNMNLTVPFGPRVVGSIVPTGTWLGHFPQETNPPKEDEDSSSPPSRRSMSRGGIAACIAIGVLVL
ncbi:hypothetical protein E4U42_003035 [Claviceps africana]|uniref:Uncharacterized protein n=1 Tax=Claviceps africana TaxID=83212 RepID=A0A8K0J7E0_9HYPO|nr:hypothetical protein E4U42_003035 [Claviceps africana]